MPDAPDTDGVEECCCGPTVCNSSKSLGYATCGAWRDQRGNPPYPCTYYTSWSIVWRDTADNSIVGTQTLITDPTFGIRFGGALQCRCTAAPGELPAGHTAFNRFQDWSFGGGMSLVTLLGIAKTFSDMVDWGTFPESRRQAVHYNADGSGSIVTDAPTVYSGDGLICGDNTQAWYQAAGNAMWHIYGNGEEIQNPGILPSWLVGRSPAPLSNFGNCARLSMHAESWTSRFRPISIPWCKKDGDYFYGLGDPNGPSYCGVAVLGPNQCVTPRTDDSGTDVGEFIISPGSDPDQYSIVQCFPCLSPSPLPPGSIEISGRASTGMGIQIAGRATVIPEAEGEYEFIEGRGHVQVTPSTVQSGRAHTEAHLSITIAGRVDVQATLGNSIAGRTSVQGQTSIAGRADVQNTQGATQSGRAAVQATMSTTQSGRAAVRVTNSTTKSGKLKVAQAAPP